MVKHGVLYRTVVCSVLMLQARLSPTLSHLQVPASSIKTDVAITGSAMVAHSTATTLIQVHTSRNSPLPAPASTVCLTMHRATFTFLYTAKAYIYIMWKAARLPF